MRSLYKKVHPLRSPPHTRPSTPRDSKKISIGWNSKMANVEKMMTHTDVADQVQVLGVDTDDGVSEFPEIDLARPIHVKH